TEIRLSMMFLLLSLAASVVFVTTLVVFFYLFFKPSKASSYKFPPGPRPWPIIGNLNVLDFLKAQETFCKLSEQYGNVFTFHMGRRKFVVLTGYQTVKEALVDQADDFGGRGQTHTSQLFSKGKGVIFGKGESWKTMRRFTLSTLRDFGMGKRTIEDRIVEESKMLIEVFESYKGQPFEPTIHINSAVSNIICTIVFGDRFEYDNPQFLRLQKLVNENIKLLVSPKMQLFNTFPFIGYFIKDLKKVSSNVKENQSFLRNLYKKSKDVVDPNDMRSFIDTFIVKQHEEEAKNSHSYFDEDNMIFTSANLFAAGTETTSTTLRWGLLMMMRYPHIQEKVKAEIERVIGRERPPRSEDRKSMPYTDAVLHEVQRFGNVVPMNLLHETTVDTTFRGYKIPKGTPVIPLLTSVLFDKTQWDTPFEFNPGHFLDAQGNFIRKEAFMPFSAGRRVCLGETLAKMELFLFFTALLQKFTFHLPPGIRPEDLNMEPVPGITASPHSYKLCAVSH
uniref:Cytochrome P450 2K1-like n=1 Tax=Lepisosteus oculatus TaxID=7918 RepID=W5MBT6_LEPOC